MVDKAKGTTLARKRGRPKSERNDVVVKIDAAIKNMAEMVAKRRDLYLSEFLSELLREPVTREFAKEMKAVEKENKTK